jgi:vacuolar-type H+-ATPase catalytic subunit A/Vma1
MTLKYINPYENWELKNVKDTAFGDGVEKGKVEGKIKEKEEIAKMMLLDNEPIDKIVRYMQLSIVQIEALKILNLKV